MGGSQSSPVLQKHLELWENALQQFEQVYNESCRVAEHDRFYGSSAPQSFDGFRTVDREEEKNDRAAGTQRRPSSLVSFNNINNNNYTSCSANNGNATNVGSVNCTDASQIGATNSLSNESSSGTSNPNLWSHRPHSIQTRPDSRQIEPRITTLGSNSTGIHSGSNTAHNSSASNIAIVPANINASNVSNTALHGNVNAGHAISTSTANDVRIRSSGEGSAPMTGRHSRQRVLELKRNRANHFKSYEITPLEHTNKSGPYGHFGAIAVALSYLLDGVKGCKDRRKRVTMEDIFFAAQVPLHMLHTGPPHLPVMADIIREFLDVDNRFKDEYGMETIHLDISPVVGQVNLGTNDVGDRQTRLQLPEFRKLITNECEEQTQVVRIVNYDPYVLEQEMIVDAYEEDDLIRSPLAASVLGNPRPLKRQYAKVNDGAYAVIVDVRNAVELLVTIAEGFVQDDEVGVKLIEVSAASLFKAMMSAEEGHRARGFIHIFHKESCPHMRCDEIDPFWTPELCSGKVLGTVEFGIHASVISYHMSKHLVGVAWAMHLLGGERLYAHGYGNGLPVSEIIRVMNFPPEVFLDGDLSIEEVYGYAKEFIKRTNRPYSVELYPVMTKVSRENAVPTISVFDLESILIDVKQANQRREAPSHVMLCMYNAGVAHNILYVSDNMQWCILAGYDEETQTALLIDAHPKMFSRTWTCALDRLHKAITGSGYIIFTNLPNTEDEVSTLAQYTDKTWQIITTSQEKNKENSEKGKTTQDYSRIHNANTPLTSTITTTTTLSKTNYNNSRNINNSNSNNNNNNNNFSNNTVGLISIFNKPSLPTIHKVGAPLSTPTMVEDRLCLVEKQNKMVARVNEVHRCESDMYTGVQSIESSFTFPSLPVMPTIIAMACSTIGVHTTFNDVVMRLPYDISSLLIRTFTLESMYVCFAKYLKYAHLECELHVTVHHCETNSEATACLSLSEFERLVRESLEAKNVIVAHYNSFKLLVHGARNPFGSLCIIRYYDVDSQTIQVEDCNPNSFQRVWCVTLQELYHAMLSYEITPLLRPYGCLILSRCTNTTHEFAAAQSRNFTLKLLPVHNLFHVSPSPHFQGMSFAFAQLGYYYSPEEIFYEAFLTTMDDQRRRGSQAYAWRDVDVSLSVINKKIDAAFIALVCSKFLDSRNAHRSVMQKKTLAEVVSEVNEVWVELIDDLDLEDELGVLLQEATTTNEMVLLLNYDTEKAHQLHGFGRSVALVKSYNPETKMVELWDAEYTVFGLSIVLSVSDLIKIGDLDNEGRSPYGFVRFSRKTSGERRKQKTRLMRAPATLEEEAEQEKIITSTLNRRERAHETTFISATDAKTS